MKKQLKKLSLNTETLRNLDPGHLKDAAGGVTRVGSACLCTATYICSNCRPCL